MKNRVLQWFHGAVAVVLLEPWMLSATYLSLGLGKPHIGRIATLRPLIERMVVTLLEKLGRYC